VARSGAHKNYCYGLRRTLLVIRYYSAYCLATGAEAALMSPLAGTDSSSQRRNKPNELDQDEVAAPQIARQ